MRLIASWLAVGLAAAWLAQGEVGAKPTKAPPASTCNGDYGTNIEFADSPKQAAEIAQKEQKLVLVLHISGHFEDPNLT